MKKLLLAAGIGLSILGLAGEAMAVCTNLTRLSAAQITTLLSGNTVCVPSVTVPTMTWQELHKADGVLIDFKRGPGHPVDPSEIVGDWKVFGTDSGNSGIFHNYTGGSTYVYSVHGSGVVGTNHSFCVGTTDIVARVKSGGGAC